MMDYRQALLNKFHSNSLSHLDELAILLSERLQFNYSTPVDVSITKIDSRGASNVYFIQFTDEKGNFLPESVYVKNFKPHLGSEVEANNLADAISKGQKTGNIIWYDNWNLAIQAIEGISYAAELKRTYSDIRHEPVLEAILNYNMQDPSGLNKFDYSKAMWDIINDTIIKLKSADAQNTDRISELIATGLLFDEFVGKRLNQLASKYPGSVHGDTAPGNILLKQNEGYLIDFFNASCALAFQDIAYTYGTFDVQRPYLKGNEAARIQAITKAKAVFGEKFKGIPGFDSNFDEALDLLTIAVSFYESVKYMDSFTPKSDMQPDVKAIVNRGYAHLECAMRIIGKKAVEDERWNYLADGLRIVVDLKNPHTSFGPGPYYTNFPIADYKIPLHLQMRSEV